MAHIIVAFSKAEDAKSIKNLLTRNGFGVIAACCTGAQVLNYTEDMNEGIVVCGASFPDMRYGDLLGYLPNGFQMLLLASQRFWGESSSPNLVNLAMPLKAHDLISTLTMMEETINRQRRRRREMPRQRSDEERKAIVDAKRVLMERNHMTEEEAHRYIQKCSMDSGTNMTETAQMILSMMGE